MKQKQETKITTLCRLCAVYNDMLCANCKDERISIWSAWRIGIRLDIGNDINKRAVFSGSLDDAISYMAVRLCELSNLPRVAVDVLF